MTKYVFAKNRYLDFKISIDFQNEDKITFTDLNEYSVVMKSTVGIAMTCNE